MPSADDEGASAAITAGLDRSSASAVSVASGRPALIMPVTDSGNVA